jgi:lipopolysaccharide/colanic/teichoic acid biosynthesis glycosyltransferase
LSWKEKFEKDVEYVDHVTFLTDLKIVCLTVKNVVKREGIEFKKGNQQIMDYFKEHDNC